MSSKEKLKKDFIKTFKNVNSLTNTLASKKKKMYTLGKKIYDTKTTILTPENSNRFVVTVPKMCNDLAELTVKNKTLLEREKQLFLDTMLYSLNSRLIIKNLQEDSKAKDWKKTVYSRKFDTLNDSILLNISLLDLEFTKLQKLHQQIEKRKISIKSSELI